MSARNIVVLHNTAKVGSAWCCAEGIVSVLSEMGHNVVDGGSPRKSKFPLERLRDADMILLGAPEWFAAELQDHYGSEWAKLPARKVAWYAESFYRDDRNFDFQAVRRIADYHYFPAYQDAERWQGKWLPFGVDTSIFRPKSVTVKYNAAFLGSIYKKRADYIGRMGFNLDLLRPVSSDNARTSFGLLADAYCSAKIFVNLPAYSRLLVTKVTEVMACGTLLLTPRLDHPSAQENMKPLEHGKHLLYYDPNRPEEIAQTVNYYLARPAEREALAKRGHDEVHEKHSLKLRLQEILDDADLG